MLLVVTGFVKFSREIAALENALLIVKKHTKVSSNFLISQRLLVRIIIATFEVDLIFKKRQVDRFKLILNFAIHLEHIKV